MKKIFVVQPLWVVFFLGAFINAIPVPEKNFEMDVVWRLVGTLKSGLRDFITRNYALFCNKNNLQKTPRGNLDGAEINTFFNMKNDFNIGEFTNIPLSLRDSIEFTKIILTGVVNHRSDVKKILNLHDSFNDLLILFIRSFEKVFYNEKIYFYIYFDGFLGSQRFGIC